MQPNLLLLAGPAANWNCNIGAEDPGPPVPVARLSLVSQLRESGPRD